MIQVRCPFTKNIFHYESEADIPEGLIFERVQAYRLTKQGKETTVYCAGPKEALTVAIGSAVGNGDSHMRLASV